MEMTAVRRVAAGLAMGLLGASAGAAQVRVLPLGDSITEGVDAAGCYRAWLWQELVEQGIEVDFVGSLHGVREGGAEGFDSDHEGHWGWRADRVAGIAEATARSTGADVALVHLGHNDLWQGEGAEEVLADLGDVVAALRRGRPGIAVLVSTLIQSAIPGLEGTVEVNAGLPELVEELYQEGEGRVLLVDAARGFDGVGMTVDGVHPNEAGARHLAAAWAEGLRPLVASVSVREERDPPRFLPCPGTPNCVSSREAEGPRRVEPLRLTAPPSEAWTVTRQVLVSWPRVRLEDAAPGYLHFTESSRWMQYVDDLELALDEEAGVIDVASRSRKGHWDLGVNRRRVERLRRRLAALGIVEAGD